MTPPTSRGGSTPLTRPQTTPKESPCRFKAVKRSAYIGGSLGREDGLHVENAEFLSTLASPGAQAAMLAYMRRTEETGDLPLYDRPTYERTLEAGSFGRTTEASR